jgi:hypothetical protein
MKTKKNKNYDYLRHRELVVLTTAILNEQHTMSPEEIKRLAKDTLNRVGLDWDKKNNGVIVK